MVSQPDYDVDATPVCRTDDCLECPYFLRFDTCRFEYSTNIYTEV
jgi:hypothetical protein